MRLVPLFFFALALSGCATIRKPFLYSAEKEGRRIVLLGTLHRGVSANDLPGIVSEELNSSKAAFFETNFYRIQSNLESEGDEKAQKELVEAFFFRKRGNSLDEPEPTLSARLPKKTWEQLKSRFPNMSPKLLNELNPNGALAILQEGSHEKVSPYEARSMNPWYSMDFRLYTWAKKKGLRIERLDRSDDVCREELEQSAVRQIQIALSGKTEGGSFDSFRELRDAYLEGNEDAIRAINAPLESGPVEECLIDRRNREWAEKIGNYPMPGEKIFVAVGALHLLTNRYPSLLRLLQNQGYTVQRISP